MAIDSGSYNSTLTGPSPYGGNVPGQPFPESTSKIRDGLSEIEGTLQALNEDVSGLEKRIDVILTPTQPQAAGTSLGKTSSLGSHVHARVYAILGEVAALRARLRDITSRIEV